MLGRWRFLALHVGGVGEVGFGVQYHVERAHVLHGFVALQVGGWIGVGLAWNNAG